MTRHVNPLLWEDLRLIPLLGIDAGVETGLSDLRAVICGEGCLAYSLSQGLSAPVAQVSALRGDGKLLKILKVTDSQLFASFCGATWNPYLILHPRCWARGDVAVERKRIALDSAGRLRHLV